MSTVVKILTGPQAGAEVPLPDGEYVLGSSDAADLLLADAAVLPRHAVLRLAGGAGAVEPAAPGAGVEVDGVPINAAVPVAFYQVITLGATHLALGPEGEWKTTPVPPAKAPEGAPAAESAGAAVENPVPVQAAERPGPEAPTPAERKRPSRVAALAIFLLLFAALTAGTWWVVRDFLAPSPVEMLAERTANRLREMGMEVAYPFSGETLPPGRLGVSVRPDGRIALDGLVAASEDRHAVLAAAALPDADVADGLRVLTEEARRAGAAVRGNHPAVSLEADEERLALNIVGVVADFPEYSRVSRTVRGALPRDVPLRNRLLIWEDARDYLERAGARLGIGEFRLTRDDGEPAFAYAGQPTAEQSAALRKAIRDNFGAPGLELFASALAEMEAPPLVAAIAVAEPERPQPAQEAEVKAPPPPVVPRQPRRKSWRVHWVGAAGFIDEAGMEHRIGDSIGGYRLVDVWSEGVVLRLGEETVFVKTGGTIEAAKAL